MKPRNGYVIVCPDNKKRHFPYGNLGDAEFDAKHISRYGCTKVLEEYPPYQPDKVSNDEIDECRAALLKEMAECIKTFGECPEGVHTVEPYTFTPTVIAES